ncbi:hypothetical protein JCM17823_01560 [Halorubrum gandharaense]
MRRRTLHTLAFLFWMPIAVYAGYAALGAGTAGMLAGGALSLACGALAAGHAYMIATVDGGEEIASAGADFQRSPLDESVVKGHGGDTEPGRLAAEKPPDGDEVDPQEREGD